MKIEADSRYWKEEFGFLVYRGPNNIPIDLPKGVTDCSYMFAGMQFGVGATLRDFDTSRVKSVYGMFEDCIIPPGFSFGDKFTGESLMDMRYFLTGAYINRSVDLSFLDKLKVPAADYMAREYNVSYYRKKALFSWRQKNNGMITLSLSDREVPERRLIKGTGESCEYALLGDTVDYKDVLVGLRHGSKDELEEYLKYEIADDDLKYAKYSNLHFEKVESNSAWWHAELD